MMSSCVYIKLLFILFVIFYAESFNNDKKCAARPYFNKSVVCVCNATYCDEVTREEIACGQYIWYTSSKAGKRFEKYVSSLQYFPPSVEYQYSTLELDLNTRYQTVEGFGGAVTDAVGINWLNLTNPQLKQHFINSYFSDKGLQYSMMRVPIGGSDFSTHVYAYNEYPENDVKLSNFSLTYEDYTYKIPFIKAASAVAKTPIHIVSSTWSPPKWMKNTHKFLGISRLKEEFFQTYADYHKKFIEKYEEEGIPIWGITTTNEPLDGAAMPPKFNCLGWTVQTFGQWIKDNLGPTIKNWKPEVNILAVDDQRLAIPLWFDAVVDWNPGSLKYVDGIAVHSYMNKYIPPDILTRTQELYKNQFILTTEFCEGAMPWQQPKVDLGSWDRAVTYILNILEDLNYNLIGWIDWNLCLNSEGGPNWVQNFVDSPVIVFPERGEFVKQPMFYAMGHFSKFIPRGSIRIQVKELSNATINNVAFITPYNTVVVVLYNDKSVNRLIRLKLGIKQASVLVEADSVTTVEIPNGCG
ncbi:lysosomal acid glucosylceramidase-like [Achroia grisella]|uniref:lysosomal acid glucosylceramidase-like n=1 Tax=Achroia grisella TaxID=688607 RepID=UPI0027D1FD33|nr:lysosomal acid glucosylceramidase-like [Achroia grisella]